MSCLKITNFRVDYRKSEMPYNLEDIGYIIVNCCFKIDTSEEEGWALSEQAKAESQEFHRVLSVDDPKKYDEWLEKKWSIKGYPAHSMVWVHQDQTWQYLEKFETFWFREWIADCVVTRAIITELQHFIANGTLLSNYRTTDSSLILRHLRTLSSYWD